MTDFDVLDQKALASARPLMGAVAWPTVILGLVTIASSRLENEEEIRERLRAALEHLPPERLIAAPDCGLGYFTREMAKEKMTILSRAAKSV